MGAKIIFIVYHVLVRRAHSVNCTDIKESGHEYHEMIILALITDIVYLPGSKGHISILHRQETALPRTERRELHTTCFNTKG